MAAKQPAAAKPFMAAAAAAAAAATPTQQVSHFPFVFSARSRGVPYEPAVA